MSEICCFVCKREIKVGEESYTINQDGFFCESCYYPYLCKKDKLTMTNTFMGWTNEPTWAVAMSIVNDGAYHSQMIREFGTDVQTLKEGLQQDHYDELNDLPNRVSKEYPYHELLAYALNQVNWGEIAEWLLEKEESNENS